MSARSTWKSRATTRFEAGCSRRTRLLPKACRLSACSNRVRRRSLDSVSVAARGVRCQVALYLDALVAALRITSVTAPGREIIERCPALTSVMWAWARFAMNSWIDDGIALSIVPTRAQLGIDFHAGGPDGAVKALNTAGPCVASRTAPSFAGRSLANPLRKTLGLTLSSASPGAAPGNGTKLNTVLGGPAPSTEPGWLESRPSADSPTI